MSALAHEAWPEGSADGRLTCLIADDHPAVLDSLARVLQRKGITVVAQVRDGDDALRAIEELKPAVAVARPPDARALGPRRGAPDRPRDGA